MPVTLLGIRHHGPGSCRHVLEYLKKHPCDLLMIEGPSEAEALLSFVADRAMKPPVALLGYQIDAPQNSAFYPFASFSPEWQAMKFAVNKNIPVRFFDLPLMHNLGIRAQLNEEEAIAAAAAAAAADKSEADTKAANGTEGTAASTEAITATKEAPAKPKRASKSKAKAADTTEASDVIEVVEVAEEAPAKKTRKRTTKADANADAANSAANEDVPAKKTRKRTKATDDAIKSLACKDIAVGEDDLEEIEEDPLNHLARIAGYDDEESWWNATIEMSTNAEDIFTAIHDAMAALREQFPERSKRDITREAWMRKSLRQAQKDGFENIVVVCGAWHTPALSDLKQYIVKDDNALLKGLPKVKVEMTWVPWTYSRLSYRSGYGAGITSPGWYEHLFKYPKDDGVQWMTKVATYLRKQQMDISVAHVLEAVRLAQTLAAFRGLSYPSLSEYNEAITTVMGFGDSVILKLVDHNLIVGNKLGTIPKDAPKVPLLADIELLQKKLRLPFQEEPKQITLDLRKPLDLGRSTFFHRLRLLGINWARNRPNYSGSGSFKEDWVLKYEPSIIIDIIENAIYGATLEATVIGYTTEKLQEYKGIQNVTNLLMLLVPCDLPVLVDTLSTKLDELSAATNDVVGMIASLPKLVKLVRYGSVRNLDLSSIDRMIGTMIERILAGGMLICINIDDKNAQSISNSLESAYRDLRTLDNEEYLNNFLELMDQLHHTVQAHPIINGCATKILYQAQRIDEKELARSILYYTSLSQDGKQMAYWLSGFLENTGTMLLINEDLWSVVNQFIKNLDLEAFNKILPILRRTFNKLEDGVITQLGVKAKNYDPHQAEHGALFDALLDNTKKELDYSDAQKGLSVLTMLLGLPSASTGAEASTGVATNADAAASTDADAEAGETVVKPKRRTSKKKDAAASNSAS